MRLIRLIPALLLMCSFLVVLSCGRGKEITPNQSPQDSANYKIKEITIEGLPSPYLRFLYHAEGLIHEIKQESNLYQYQLQYENHKLISMINKANLDFDSLKYQYEGDRVVKIYRSTVSSGKIEEINLLYDVSGRLVELDWLNMATGKVFKKLVIQYGMDNNMHQYEEYYHHADTLLKTATHIFSGFDKNVNVTANLIIRDIHYLHLPGIRLQRNNPSEELVLGVNRDMQIKFSYEYQGQLPVSKLSKMKITRGDGLGLELNNYTRITYY
ncbi:hypothetical protein [Flavihumibacter sp. UBA7668]|uniref:hypothetical protein n=1 Tax=Flavihumibacter sp. UBA7668 TaxID=1946542 RepID=UPI0025B88D6F|nr:hypothetical protein [Flavihumibacter sp. UBA7668]